MNAHHGNPRSGAPAPFVIPDARLSTLVIPDARLSTLVIPGARLSTLVIPDARSAIRNPALVRSVDPELDSGFSLREPRNDEGKMAQRLRQLFDGSRA